MRIPSAFLLVQLALITKVNATTYQYPLVFTTSSPLKDQRYNCMDYDGSDFVYIGGTAAGNSLISSNDDTAFVLKYSTTAMTINTSVKIGPGFDHAFACKLSGSKLVVGTVSDFSVGLLDPSTFAAQAYYTLGATSTGVFLQPEAYYKDNYLYGAFYDPQDSKLRVFSILTTTHAYVIKTVSVTIQKSYAIAAINDQMFVPAISSTSNPTAYQFSFKYSDLTVTYSSSYNSISGAGLELDAVSIVKGSTNSAVSFCGPKNTDKKIWMIWGKWTTAANVGLTNPDSHKVVEAEPNNGFDSACMAISIQLSNVSKVYYAVGVAKNSAFSSWDFYIIFNSMDSTSSKIKEVLNNDITHLYRSTYRNIKGGMQYGPVVDQFFFLGSTTSDSKGFLFTTDFSTKKCTSSSASMGSYASMSSGYSSATFSTASVALATESRAISNYLSSVTITNFSGSYDANCSNQATAITVSAPSTMPTTWSYTVGDGDRSLSFDTFTCSSTCTLTYVATINGGSDFGLLIGLLTFNSSTRTFTLSSSTTNSCVGTYTIQVYGTADSSSTNLEVATITLTINSLPVTLLPSTAVPTTWAYTVGTGTQTLTFDSFVCNTGCGTITHSAYLSGQSDFGTLNTFLTFNPTTRTFSLTVASNTLAATYTIVVKAIESMYSTTNTSNTITLTISPEVLTLTPSGAQQSTWAYTVGDGAASLPFTSYVCNQPCGTISYSADINGQANFGVLNTYLSFDSGALEFSLNVDSNSLAATYRINVIIQENQYSTTSGHSIELTISPFTAPTFSPPSNFEATAEYTVAEATYSFGFDDFTCSPACGTITYTAYLTGEADFGVLNSYLSFDSVNRRFSISSDIDTHVGTYTIVIQAQSQFGPFTNTDSSIALTINPRIITLSPPGTFVATQTYTAGSGAYPFGFDDFTCSSSCGIISYNAYLSGETDFGDLNGYLTFDSSSRSFSIDTSLNSLANTYTIVVEAVASTGPITNNANTITLTINPFTTMISPPTNFVATKAYTAANPAETFGFDNFICTPSCGIITYSAYLDGSTDFGILQTYLSFDQTNRLFSISTNNISHVGTHVIRIKAETSFGPVSSTLNTITLTISPYTIILNHPVTMPSSWAYTVNSGATSLTFNTYTCNLSCGTITYQAYLSGQSDFGALNSYLSFSSGGRLLSLANIPTNTLVGTYNIVIEATEDQGPTVNVSQTIALTISPVVVTFATPGDFTNQAYTVGAGVATKTFSVFTCSPACGTISYTANLNGFLNFGSLVPFLAFNAASRQFTLTGVNSNAQVGTYQLEVNVSEDQFDTAQTFSFDLVISSYTPILLNEPVIADLTLVIEEGIKTLQIDPYTVQIYSGSDLVINYSGSYTDDILFSSSTPIDGITFDSATRTFTFDPALRTGNTRDVKVWATPTTTTTSVTVYTQIFQVSYINVSLIPPDLSTIRTVAYSVLDGSQDYTFSDYTSFETIGALSYSAALSGGGALPTCISFNGALRKFTVNCPNNSDAGTLSIMITAKEALYDVQNDDELITLTISPVDLNSYLVASAVDPIAFEVGTDTTRTSTFAEWTSGAYLGTLDLTYSLVAPPACITLSGNTVSVNGALAADVGTYNLVIQATDAITGEVYTVTSTVEVQITISQSNNAPSWDGTFFNQKLFETETILFILPFWNDLDLSDSHTFAMQTDAGFLTLDTNLKVINIEPQLGDEGIYEVTLTVTDDNLLGPLSDSETFEIEVLPYEELAVDSPATEQTNSTSSSAAQKVDFTAFERKDMPSPTAKITDMNNYGLIKVEFSQKMMTPANITAIDKESLNFVVYSESELFDPDTVILDWKVIQFSEKFMRIQLEFDNPMLISSTSDIDKIELGFFESGTFISSESFKQIKEGTSDLLIKQMPMQMKETSALASLGAISGSIEKGSAGFALVTFFVQLILSGSLALLWGMVNTLQIIVHMPLMNITLPPNASSFTSALVSLASFDFIPIDKINKIVFGIEPEPEKQVRYQSVGMDTTNFILNCAQMLFAFFAWFGFVVLHQIFKLLSRCFPKMLIIAAKLEEKIYYGMLIVLCLESYLEVLISSFIQNKVISWSSSGAIVSSIISILFSIFFTTLPFLIYGILKMSVQILRRNRINEKFGALFGEFRIDQKNTRMFNFFFLLRRLLYAIVLVFSEEFVCMQLTVLNIGSFVIMQYVLNVRPYRKAYMNRLELANESIILSLTYILWTFSDYQGDVNMKMQLGWLYCFVIAICLGINFGVMLYFAVWVSCKKKYEKAKLKREQKEAMKFLQEWSKSHVVVNQAQKQMEPNIEKSNIVALTKRNSPNNAKKSTLIPLKQKMSFKKAQVKRVQQEKKKEIIQYNTNEELIQSKSNPEEQLITSRNKQEESPIQKKSEQLTDFTKASQLGNSQAQKEASHVQSYKFLHEKSQLPDQHLDSSMHPLDLYLASGTFINNDESSAPGKKQRKRKNQFDSIQKINASQGSTLNNQSGEMKNGTPIPTNNVTSFFHRQRFKNKNQAKSQMFD